MDSWSEGAVEGIKSQVDGHIEREQTLVTELPKETVLAFNRTRGRAHNLDG